MHLAEREFVTLSIVGKLAELFVRQFRDNFGTHAGIIHLNSSCISDAPGYTPNQIQAEARALGMKMRSGCSAVSLLSRTSRGAVYTSPSLFLMT